MVMLIDVTPTLTYDIIDVVEKIKKCSMLGRFKFNHMQICCKNRSHENSPISIFEL